MNPDFALLKSAFLGRKSEFGIMRADFCEGIPVICPLIYQFIIL